MRRLGALLAAFAIATAASLVVTEPAQAASTPVIWVDVRVNSAWPVSRAVTYVDSYTGSRMRYGTCRAGARCIVIREDGSLPSSYAAVTSVGYPVTRIRLNSHRRWYPYAQRLHTVVHELGHARGLYTHNPRCTSVMYYKMRCPDGRLAPLAFTSAERATLRRH